jgi:uncharacterized membrane protein
LTDDLQNGGNRTELARAILDLSLRVQRLERRLDEIAARFADSDTHDSKFAAPSAPTARSALESRIAAQWLNKVGVVAVLFGVAYLLRYAFVQQWISAAAWIWLGVWSGLFVIGGSEWFRRRGYRVLSLSLKATGIGVSYLSLWAGLELYKLLTGPETFAGFVSITILAGILALRESAEVLAGLALLGGFLTPLLISIPSQEVPLFAYLAMLDSALSVIVIRRNWWRLLPLELLGTGVLSGTWYFNHYRPTEQATAVTAATLFFAIFFATLVLRRRRLPEAAMLLLDLTEIANPLLYFAALYLLLDRLDHNALTLPAAALAVVYFVLAQRAGRSLTSASVRAVPLCGGIGIAFVAICLAVLLPVDWLSLGWFLQAAVIMAIGFWRDLPWLRWGSLLLLCAAVVKAFAYDVWQLDLAYRTLSFIGLGILLLAISFAYQRYGFSLLTKSEKDTSGLP